VQQVLQKSLDVRWHSTSTILMSGSAEGSSRSQRKVVDRKMWNYSEATAFRESVPPCGLRGQT
jgi:hypothetical protein